MPDEAKRQLENVHVFGLDLAALDVTPRRQAGSVIRSERKGKGREVSPSIRSPPPGQATYPNATDSPISGKPYVKAVHQADSQLDEDNSDSEEEGMPIRPLTQGAKSERRVFDPLSFATGSEPSGGNQSDKETEGNEDEDGLSDYEKKQRRRGVAITLAETGENESQEVKITVTVQKGIQKGIQKGTSFADLETASQSLPESQRSAEDFTLSRYADPLQLHAPELPASATSRVLVDDSDQSHPQTVGSHSLSQGAPQPNAIQPTPVKRQRSSSPISRGEDSHPNAEADTSAEAHADDELSQQGSAKRVKTSPPSALSFLNPLNYLRSASRPLRMKEEPVSDPSKRTKGSSSEERIGGSASGSGSVWRKLAVWGRNDEIDTGDDQSHYNGSPRAKISSHQDGSPSAKIFSPKAEVLISKSPSRALALRAQLPCPISAKKRSVHSPAKAQVTRQPVFEPNDQHSARSTRLPSPPVVRHPKLRGFRPDLVPLDGLSKKWVVESTKVAEDFRRAKAARGKTA